MTHLNKFYNRQLTNFIPPLNLPSTLFIVLNILLAKTNTALQLDLSRLMLVSLVQFLPALTSILPKTLFVVIVFRFYGLPIIKCMLSVFTRAIGKVNILSDMMTATIKDYVSTEHWKLHSNDENSALNAKSTSALNGYPLVNYDGLVILLLFKKNLETNPS